MSECTHLWPSRKPKERNVASLDQYYISTCYPNGLPGGISFEAYNVKNGERALRLAGQALDAVREHVD